MATVKGDVHDIGKNIVGVVLGCNNYEVIDLGVMVPAAKILDTAIERQRRHDRPERPDHAVARRDGDGRARDGAAEDEAAAADRRRDHQPSAHGRQDRAGAIAAGRPRARRLARRGRRGQPDQPRAPRRLRSQQPRGAGGDSRALQDAQREAAAAVRAGARESAAYDWDDARHGDAGVRRTAIPGRRPAGAAREVHRLDLLLLGVGAEGPLSRDPRAPAVRRGGARAVRPRAGAPEGDHRRPAPDGARASMRSGRRPPKATTSSSTRTRIAARSSPGCRCCASRKRSPTSGRTCRSPTTSRRAAAACPTTSACSPSPAGIGTDALVARFEADHDDYRAIIVKALADRLAEAFATLAARAGARRLGPSRHAQCRSDGLLHEKHRGIRPAPGYPACPDHSGKFDLFRSRRRAPGAGADRDAAMPPASVSGFYFSHPLAKYFNVGRIGRDQASRTRGAAAFRSEETERWLSTELGYEAAEFE